MMNLDNPIFVSISLKLKKDGKVQSNIPNNMAQIIERLKNDELEYLFVTGNILKIVPVWKIGSIINLTKEYTSKVKKEKEKINIEHKELEFLKNKSVALIISFKEENNISTDMKDYMNNNLSKKYMSISTSEVYDLEQMIKLYKSIFDVESVELLKLD